MTDLEARLRSLRGSRSAPPAPADLRVRAGRRRRHRRLGFLTFVAVALVGAGLAWNLEDDPESRVIAGPGSDDDEHGSSRTIGEVSGVSLSVSPQEGIGDGDVIEVQVDGIDALPRAVILVCTGDVFESNAEAACDPESVQQTNAEIGAFVDAIDGTQRVTVSRIISIRDRSGDPNQSIDYDCATEPAGCVLAVGPYELPARAVVVSLSFRDEDRPDPSASLSQSRELVEGQNVTLRAEGLSPNRTYGVRLCQVSPGEMCDEIGSWPSAKADESGTLDLAVKVHAALYSWRGRVDCVDERCAVVVVDRGQRRAERPFAFAEGVVAPLPLLEITPAGPYVDGQQVTVHGSGFRPGLEVGSQLGQCPAHLDTAVEERCGYPRAFSPKIVVEADGTFAATVTISESLALTGTCVGDPGCLLAWIIPHGPIGASVGLEIVG